MARTPSLLGIDARVSAALRLLRFSPVGSVTPGGLAGLLGPGPAPRWRSVPAVLASRGVGPAAVRNPAPAPSSPVTVADYISRADSQSRQRAPQKEPREKSTEDDTPRQKVGVEPAGGGGAGSRRSLSG